jgi:hypothetical protein
MYDDLHANSSTLLHIHESTRDMDTVLRVEWAPPTIDGNVQTAVVDYVRLRALDIVQPPVAVHIVNNESPGYQHDFPGNNIIMILFTAFIGLLCIWLCAKGKRACIASTSATHMCAHRAGWSTIIGRRNDSRVIGGTSRQL